MENRRRYSRRGISVGKIIAWPEDAKSPEELAKLVEYTGSNVHKTYDSPAGPPANYADKSKCDVYDPRDWHRLRHSLQEAIRAKAVGPFRGRFPSRAWVWINGVLHEARLTNQETGEYHGFPITDSRQYPEPADLLEEIPHVEIPAVRDRSDPPTGG